MPGSVSRALIGRFDTMTSFETNGAPLQGPPPSRTLRRSSRLKVADFFSFQHQDGRHDDRGGGVGPTPPAGRHGNRRQVGRGGH